MDPTAQSGRVERPAVSIRDRLARLQPEQRALLEQRLRRAGRADEAVPPSVLPPIPRRTEGEAPVGSSAQHHMWLLEQMEPGTALQTICLHVQIRGPLEIGALDRSMREIVRRHEPLRTTFILHDGRLSPIPQPVPDLLLAVVDLRSGASPESEARASIAAEVGRPFDLVRELPFRAQLFRIDAESCALLITVHHVAFDRWSTGILWRELSALYETYMQRRSAPLRELPIRYSDYAAWQRQRLEDASLRSSIDYWLARLRDAPPWLELPTDRPRPAVSSHQSRTAEIELPRVLCEPLDALCAREGVTHFVALLSAYLVLLKRYSGQGTIVVGTPVTGREHPDVEGLIGIFANVLPIAVDLSDEGLTYRQLLGRVCSEIAGALRHQHVPFEQLVAALNPRRRPGISPVFQTMLTVHPRNHVEFALDGCVVNELYVDSSTIDHDLRMSVVPLGTGADSRASLGTLAHGMRVRLRYRTDLFDATTAERLLSHYRMLIERAVAAPDQPIARISLLLQAERHHILSEWNDTACALEPPLLLHEQFRAQVTRSPDAIALVCEDRSLTYRELDTRSDGLARELIRRGVGPDVCVGVLLERGSDLIASLLGILKAGGAYLPLDPSLPRDRIEFMVKDARPSVILTLHRLVERLSAPSVPFLLLDDERCSDRDSTEIPHPASGPSDLAYVLYTSGSTGIPKGVAVPHQGLSNLIMGFQKLLNLEPSDVVAAIAPLSFDIAGLEIWLPLVIGAKVVLSADSVGRNSFALADLLRDSKVTFLQATPAGWRGLFETGWRGDGTLKAVVGGEALPEDLADRVASQTREAWNAYGPTETTIWSTAKRLHPGERPVSIGRPLANTTIFVLDPNGEPVPVGIPGEICIGGLGLARGYLNRPDLTAEKFIPNPIAELPPAMEMTMPPSVAALCTRLYRTGDLGRFLPNGEIECMGRLDHQVKLRGYRIELGEIENVLLRHPSVHQAVVVVREDTPGVRYLAAYVVRQDSTDPEGRALRRHLEDVLPPYMVPTVVTALPALPLSRHGKIDRAALPAPEQTHGQGSRAPIPARDAIEQALILIWEDLLAVRPIGVRDDFFELGGQSLLAVRLMVRVQERFGTMIPLGHFLQSPTVESLSLLLRGQASRSISSSAIPLQTRGTGAPFFLVAGLGGGVSAYVELARRLGPDRPFYVLSGADWEDPHPPLSEMEQVAAQCLAAMRSVQAEGPYLLGGYSFGGLVAFEMAQQLHQCGEAVTHLALIDTAHPSIQEPAPLETDEDRRLLWILARNLGVRIDLTELLSLSKEAAWTRVYNALVQYSVIPSGVGLAQLQRGIALTGAQLHAAIHYAPRPYPGSMKCFVATEQERPDGDRPPERTDAVAGWRELSPSPLAVCEVPGTHRSMLQPPSVKILAAQLRDYLNGGRA